MYSSVQSRRIRGSAGEPLPTVFQALDNAGTRFLRGQLSLVAAGPGTGKSVFALTLALQSGVNSMYFSADSDPATQVAREIAISAGWSIERATEAVLAPELPAEAYEKLSGLPIRFDFRASPSLDDIEGIMESYEEVYGDYPALIVVDNITNVRTDSSDSDDPFGGLESMMDYLHTMARETQAHVMGLHHVTGPYNDGDKPIPLSGIKGQIGRVPELILTLHKTPDPLEVMDTLHVSTVKNRGGKADASGYSFVDLMFNGNMMKIADFRSA